MFDSFVARDMDGGSGSRSHPGRFKVARNRTLGDCESSPYTPSQFVASRANREVNEAYVRFVEDLRLALVDIAAEGSKFTEFRRQAEDLFAASGARTEARWDEARARARRGEIDLDCARGYIPQLPRS